VRVVSRVPVTAAAVRTSFAYISCRTLLRHDTVVEDVHEAVVQAPPDKLAVALRCVYPKLRPVTVTDDPPLKAKL
jgi:hypothetical protein